MYILSLSTRTAPTLDSRVPRLHPHPSPNLCMFKEDGVGWGRRVTWWGALRPRLPRIGSELASARVDIRLAAAGEWPFDWGGAFQKVEACASTFHRAPGREFTRRPGGPKGENWGALEGTCRT